MGIDIYIADGPGEGFYEDVAFERPPEHLLLALSQIDHTVAILEPGDDLVIGEVGVEYRFSTPAFECCSGCGGCHISYHYEVVRELRAT